jgi:hypothetical protein
MQAQVPEKHGAHAEKIALGGRIYHVRRTFDLMVRIEERAGPLMTILRAINDGHRDIAHLPVAKLAAVYEAVLDGENVPRHEIEDHILTAGPMRAMQPIAALILNLFIGDERFQKRLQAAKDEGDLNPQTAASSHGPTFLERRQD